MSKPEKLVGRRVTYTLEMAGKLYVVEHVPARVDEVTLLKQWTSYSTQA